MRVTALALIAQRTRPLRFRIGIRSVVPPRSRMTAAGPLHTEPPPGQRATRDLATGVTVVLSTVVGLPRAPRHSIMKPPGIASPPRTSFAERVGNRPCLSSLTNDMRHRVLRLEPEVRGVCPVAADRGVGFPWSGALPSASAATTGLTSTVGNNYDSYVVAISAFF